MKHLYKFSLLLLAFLLPATALAHDFEVDGIYYNINGNEATVTYKGTYSSQYSNEYSGYVTIPSTVTYGGNTYSVTKIGYYAFCRCTGLTSITIPNSVTTIDNYAFDGCRGLTSVTLGNSVTSIGSSAFSDCSSLTSITIPNSVTSIGSNAFDGTPWYNNQPDGLVYAGLVAYEYKGTMPNGTSITLRNGTLGIASSAFSGCSGMTSIDIPNSVTTIGYSAFSYCSSLTSIEIPNSVTYISEDAFYDCNGLISIKVDNDNPNYDSRDNCNAIIKTATNSLIFGCMNTVIPNSVTSIGDFAFVGCSGLTSIDIPNSVTNIGGEAFIDCTGLTSITIGSSVAAIGYAAFQGCSGLSSVHIRDLAAWCNIDFHPFDFVFSSNPLHFAHHLFLNGEEIKDLVIPSTVTTIKDGAFIGCTGLTSVTIPSSVTAIGLFAFEGCTNLASLTSNSFTNCISHVAFYGCSGISSIMIENGNPIYDSRNDCNAIIETASNTLVFGCKNTVIPNSVTTIGWGAFSGCTGLTNIAIPNSVIFIDGNAFESCRELTSATIGNSVASIGEEAFSGCSSLTDIYCLNLSPPTIDSYTFYGCYGASLYVPDNALDNYKAADYWKEFTNIESITFEVDSKYYRVMDESSVSVMANNGAGTLYSGDVVIPDSVTYEGYTFAVTGIEGNAFEDCYELTSITIPNSVETIGEQAFQGCTGLKSLTIGSGVTAIGAKAFNYCNALETVKCLGTVPPVMASADCFSTAAYNRATLLVPRQFVDAYTAADYWYKFAHIDGWGSAGRGDIDGDGEVSIRDVTRMIDAILTGDNEGVYFESADLNSNDRLDIGDVTTIIDMLLNGE